MMSSNSWLTPQDKAILSPPQGIITKQAKMDCDGLIEECNEVIVMLEKMRNELLAIRQEEEKHDKNKH